MEELKTKAITIRIEPELYKKIEIRAKEENRQMSSFVRHTIITYIEKIEEAERLRRKQSTTRQEAAEETLDESEYRNTGNDGKGRHRAPQRKREHTETENDNERTQEETGTAEERTTNAGADRNGAAAD